MITEPGGTAIPEAGRPDAAPVPAPAPAPVPAPVLAPPPEPGPHLLVVEDEPVIASLLADVLTRHGYRVTQCHSVGEGLALAAAHGDLALCISDFLLPDRTGLDLARALAQRKPTLPVVLISAFLEPDLIARIQAERSVALIVRKPLDIFGLRDRIDALLGRAGVAPKPGAGLDGGGLKTWEATC